MQVVQADTDVISKSYDDKSGNVGILAASDIVHIHRQSAFKLKKACKLSLQLHYPSGRSERKQRSMCLVHMTSAGFKILHLSSSECEFVGENVTVPVSGFCG